MTVELTQRQCEVLHLYNNGLGQREIAERLGCERATIRGTIYAVYCKLGAFSKKEAVQIARERGLIS